MSEQVSEQVYTAGEVIFDVDEPECDALYFVMAGKVKVEAKFDLIQEHRFPLQNDEWEIETQTSKICYFVKQLEKGGFFGLEELVEIGLHLYNRNDEAARRVKRKLCVTAI